jgi:hypothetical protein
MQLAVAFAPTMLTGLLPKVGLLAAGVGLTYLSHAGQKQKNAQRLNDLKVSSSSYGKGLTKCWGTWRCTGNMFWATDIVEEKKYISNKGKDLGGKMGSKKADKGKAQEVFLYYGNFAMALCEGTKYAILRVWADSNLIFDQYNPGGYTDDNGTFHPVVSIGFSQPSESHGSKSGAAQKKGENRDSSHFNFRFYSGSEDQEPDPFMVEKSGFWQTPAYRGVCYLMFEHFPLMDFGNRIPTITVEVVPEIIRSPVLVKWTPLANDDPAANGLTPTNLFNTVSAGAAIDVSRGHLVQQDSGNIVRVWDITNQHEIARYDLTADQSFIGITGAGNIATNWHPGASITQNVGSINPNTGLETITTSNDYNYPIRAIGIPQVTETSAGIATAYLGLFGSVQIAQEGGALDGGLPILGALPGSGLNVSNVSVGAPGTQHDIIGWTQVGDGIIYAANTMGVGPVSDTNPIPSMWEPFLVVPDPDPFYNFVHAVVYSLSAQRYLMLWTKFSGGPQYTIFDLDRTVVFSGPIQTDGNISAITHQGTQPIPILSGSHYMFISGSVFAQSLVDIDIERAIYTQNTMPFYSVVHGNSIPLATGPQYFLENQGAVVFWSDNSGGSGATYGPSWYTVYPNKFIQVLVDISTIITDCCNAVGIPTTQINLANLNNYLIRGYAIDNPTPARRIIEDIAQVAFFDALDSENSIKFISRGNGARVDIPQDDLAWIGGGTGDSTEVQDFYEETRNQEIDLPKSVMFSYMNAHKEYQVDTAFYTRAIAPISVMQSREVLDVNLPIAMWPDQAASIAEQINLAIWTERGQHHFVLPWKYMVYEPTDKFFVKMDSGLRFYDRAIKIELGANLSIDVETVWNTEPFYDAVSADPPDLHSPYEPVSTADNPGGVVPIDVPPTPATTTIMMDIPFATDEDASVAAGTGGFPVYWAAGALGPGFTGAGFTTTTTGSTWANEGTTMFDAVWGTTMTAVPAPPDGAFVTDTTSVIKLSPSYDYEAAGAYAWASIADADWPSTANEILIGQEIMYFKNVTVNADHSIEISTLIRGARGTDWVAGAHRLNEKWVLLSGPGIQEAILPSDWLNTSVTGKVSSGVLTLSPTQTVTFKGNAYRPWAPNDIQRADSAGDSVLTWQRRARVNGQLQDLIGTVPLVEASERYRVFISTAAVNPATFDPGDATSYVRFTDVATTTWTYTSAMKAIDGVGALDSFWVVVCQISDLVGLGFPGVQQTFTDTPTYR